MVVNTFVGHLLTGGLFMFLGLLWAVKYPVKYLGQKSKYSVRISKILHWVKFLEWGGIIFLCTLAILSEQLMPQSPHFRLYNEETHQWIRLNFWQHSTMHFFFVMTGVVGILTHCKYIIPVGLDSFFFSLTLFNEGMLFYTHAERMSALDQYIHYIMLIPIWSGAVCSLIEVWSRNNPILELFRTAVFITQGTWMWQIAFVLFPRWGAGSWDHNDTHSCMFLAMCYSWHLEGVILFLFIVYGIVYWYAMKSGSKRN
ncbi:LOW QUALITY PROTEIN: transmembrane protein 45B-like [Sceloporus undulatus]|uniref:LOW QUALITY PROTEIN: transmembrane protein 45B-like n=1 Tax=Sceloporus undulatus TaxID=8520 RepID=UPI001C4B5378|nr:LOW QUALITY PROTEIN: transmembrane protein 45B-like [Sceloporus undulatus]